jgi:eukaryotic-like serine/threonine-protein kinase
MAVIGTNIHGYQIMSFIDSGGFGSVYKATKDGTTYAIKIFREDYVLKEFKQKGANNRIQREIDIMKSVNHPYLIKYVDDFRTELASVPSYFLVMEFASGITLRQLIDKRSLTERESLFIFQQIIEGVAALHNIRGEEEDKGIIHRDLKPENIIVDTAKKTIKILDYGISKVIDYTSITATGNVMGSPAYMSPEQITDSKHIDKRSDLYTSGVILYEMLTNHFPYEFKSLPELVEKIKSETPIPPRVHLPFIYNKTENIILKLLEKDAYKRFPNTKVLLQSLSSSEIKISEKVSDLTPRFILRLWNEKLAMETYLKRNPDKIYIEFPANFQNQQKNLLKLVSGARFEKIIDPATMRFAYPAQQDVKGLQELPYAPPKFEVITPDFLSANSKKQQYVKQVIDEQFKLGADIFVSPYHYIHNTNVPATQRKNPVAAWFDLDIKLLRESIDYKASVSAYESKKLYAGICLNGDSLLDPGHQKDLLNMFSSFDCDGYFIYVDRIDNTTNSTVLYHYIKMLKTLQQSTGKPVIAGRINSLGFGLLCEGITGFSSGTARFDSFYEGLYKDETDAYNMYERYYVPSLLGLISIDRKKPVKLKSIFDVIGPCDCFYCKGKTYLQVVESANSKLHFLENFHNEVSFIKDLPPNERKAYFMKKIERALYYYGKLSSVFKTTDYQYLTNWKTVFEAIKS